MGALTWQEIDKEIEKAKLTLDKINVKRFLKEYGDDVDTAMDAICDYCCDKFEIDDVFEWMTDDEFMDYVEERYDNIRFDEIVKYVPRFF